MALWTPANLATAPIEWFSGDSGVTGSPVSAVTNRGTNLGLSQGTAGNRPTITGTLNSLPVFGFNGSNVILQSTGNNSYAAGPYHVFIVQKRTTTARYDNHFRAGNAWSSSVGLSTQWRSNDNFEFFGNGFGPIYTSSSTGPAGSITTPAEGTDGNWHIIEVKFASSPAVWFNANAKTLNSSFTGFNVQSMTSPLIFGNNNNTGNNEGINGSVAEFILLNYTPTSTEQEKIQGYLAWKWGNTGTTATDIVSRLPVGHTYKSAAPQDTSPQTVTGALYTDTDTFSAATIKLNVTGGLYSDADSFFGATIFQPVNGALFTDVDTFFGATLVVSVGGALFTDADTFFGSAVRLNVTGGLLTDTDTFYAAQVSGSGMVAGALYVDPDSFPSAQISQIDDPAAASARAAIPIVRRRRKGG